MSEKPDERIILKGEDALKLWRQGKDAWNKWVKENPKADIDFFAADFSKERHAINSNIISFEDFIFPSGKISFAYTNFGEGNVDFSHTTFGEGYIDFAYTIFGEGYVDFSYTKFGKVDVNFSAAEFGEGYVNFSASEFGEGDVNFSHTKFGEGYVNFSKAKFSEGDVNFSHTKFGEGYVDFSYTKFGKGDVDFSHTKFGEGYVDFSYARFGEGDVDFSHTVFKSNILFETLNHVSRVYSFSFRHAVFDGPLEISTNHGEAFSCVPDLTGTKTSHQVSLEGLRCSFSRRHSNFINMRNNYYPKFGIFKGNWLGQKIATDPEDPERLRRLKELAEDNKDHQKALDFHVMEMKAMRKFKPSKWWPLPLLFNSEFWFEKLSDYGRSIEQPIAVLLFVWIVFSWIYLLYSYISVKTLDMFSALAFGGAQIMAFIPLSRSAKEQMAESLFGSDKIPPEIFLLGFTQSIISLVLIFLIGLALKHRFKL